MYIDKARLCILTTPPPSIFIVCFFKLRIHISVSPRFGPRCYQQLPYKVPSSQIATDIRLYSGCFCWATTSQWIQYLTVFFYSSCSCNIFLVYLKYYLGLDSVPERRVFFICQVGKFMVLDLVEFIVRISVSISLLVFSSHDNPDPN